MRSWLRIVAVTLLVLSLGLHWAILQTVAWTGMLISYSRSSGLSEGISRTFDGQHPCPLCRLVTEGRAKERQPNPQTPATSSKLDPALPWFPFAYDFAGRFENPRHPDRFALKRRESPPKPPPRSALA